MAVRKFADLANETDSAFNNVKSTKARLKITERFDDTTHNEQVADEALQFLNKKLDEVIDSLNTNINKTGITSGQASAIIANTAKVTNSDQSKADINALDITEVGTISSGVWQGTTIKTAYIGDDQVTADKLANSINSAIAANTSKNTNVSTNLGKTTHASQITITSSDGDNVVIGEATGTIAGLMSKAHHDKLDGITTSANNYSLPLASSTRGGVKIGFTESGKNYPVELSSEKMFVNVPWTDNNTTYSVGDGGLSQKNFTTTLKNKLDGIEASATADQSKADINALDITEVGTISSGVWQGTTIKTAYIGDDQITEAKLANSLLAEIDANTAKTGISTSQASAITANTNKTGISTSQASAITANSAKTGITSTQAGHITANNAKIGTETDLSVTEGMVLKATVAESRGTYTLTFTVTHGRVTKTANITMS
ncbi:hypothetical protein N9Z72_00350 [Akkermansiaceae bacterium]|nr:hypothetical protein [Akkermansiaceae bacterium]